MEELITPHGVVSLQRIPAISTQQQGNLRAWDAADEYLLNELADNEHLTPNSRILIINDSFGALACSLSQFNTVSWGDSYVSHLAAQHNQHLNQQSTLTTTLASTRSPEGQFDLVLIKIPKTLALLEQQLIDLKPVLTQDTTIIAGGMVKYLQKSHQQLIERYIGNTRTSLAVKKARLYFCENEKTDLLPDSPYPQQIELKELGLSLSNQANVFSREKLDIGSRFMLQQFNHLPTANTIIDLGCGNGLLGICAQRQQPDSCLYFVDESYMAIASAQQNYIENCATTNTANQNHQFILSDCLEQSELTDIDLILCNPPFHQNNTVGDQTAWRMFSQSKRALKKGGSLWVIGNRHLNYHAKLKRLFGNCRTIASNKKFVVLETKKS